MRRSFRELPTILCAAIGLLSVHSVRPEAGPALAPQQIYERVLPSILTLKVLNKDGDWYTGSAFLALKQGIAVTAWHTVHDAQHVYGILADGTRAEVLGLVDRDMSHDLALVRVGQTDHPLVQIQEEPPSIGSRLYAFGAPKGFSFSIVDGLLSQKQTIDGFTQYQMSCPISTGNSGGPVVDDRGAVVGVVSWSRLDAQNVNFAVPIHYLESLDPNRPAVPWVEANLHRRELPQESASNHVSNPDNGLAALRTYLRKAAGREIRVIVQESDSDRSEEFRFVVPE